MAGTVAGDSGTSLRHFPAEIELLQKIPAVVAAVAADVVAVVVAAVAAEDYFVAVKSADQMSDLVQTASMWSLARQ